MMNTTFGRLCGDLAATAGSLKNKEPKASINPTEDRSQTER
ncbi:hypothetical protein [Rubinisphaera italica]|nr:hypothetical protein [Rubinisphaera italica]